VVSKEAGGKPDVVLVATGSEVQVAVAARKLLEPKLSVRVVSAPCREAFAKQPDAVRHAVVPAGAKVVVIEAGIRQGWGDVFPQPLLFLGMDRFGASAPAEKLAAEFGFTGDSVASRVRAWLDNTDTPGGKGTS
jgi:transketolase